GPMSVWLWWSILSLGLIANAILTFWCLRLLREVMSLTRQIEANALLLRKVAADTQASLVHLAASSGRVVAALDAKAETEQELWTGVFLPDDRSQADFERSLKISEDRAISTSHPRVQYSSRPSPGSPSGSPREPLIRPARPSGPR